MKRIVLIILIIAIALFSEIHGQNVLTLKECYDMAFLSNALAGEKDAYSRIADIREENLSKEWLPTIDANGSINYNSSVVDLSSSLGSLPIPGIADAIKPIPNEQYRVTLDLNQVIYDGGVIKGARALEKAELLVNEKQTEVDIYKLRGQINTYYFSLLILGKQKELITNYVNLIQKRISSMQSALANGVIIKSDIDVLTAEKIRLGQELSENEIRKLSIQKILSDIIGSVIDQSTVLVLPATEDEITDELLRPELQLFDLRKEQLSAGSKLLDAKRMPKAFGFATLGYGNPPGSNFFKDEFAPFYVVGAGMKWNIFDWNKTKNEKQLVSLQQGIIENRKIDLTANLRRLLDLKYSEIINIQSLLNTDNELITLRKRISASAESKYENGTITASEYLNELNSEHQAMINFEIHKITLALAKTEYLNISGKEID